MKVVKYWKAYFMSLNFLPVGNLEISIKGEKTSRNPNMKKPLSKLQSEQFL